jgi:hypothetical protein
VYDVNIYCYDPLLSDAVIEHFEFKSITKIGKETDEVIILLRTYSLKESMEQILDEVN